MPAIDHREDLPLFLFRAGSVLFLLLLVSVFTLYRESMGWTAWPLPVLASALLLFAYNIGHIHAFVARYRDDRRGSVLALSGLGGMLALLFLSLDAPEMAGSLAAFWIARTPDACKLRHCFLLVLAVSVLYLVMLLSRGADAGSLIGWLLALPFYGFVLSIAYSSERERKLRAESVALNRELRAAQAKLAKAAKLDERLRIARDMHDLLGHHLTALVLNLEVATHKVSGDALSLVEQSRALAKLLLSDLRAAVSDLRDTSSVDFHVRLAGILSGVPGIVMDVDVKKDLQVDDADVAEALLRCVQESLTNTLRHAGATTYRLRLYCEGASVVLEASDDGKVRGDLRPGNGLWGMQERVQALAGKLQWRKRGDGLFLRAELPLTEPAP